MYLLDVVNFPFIPFTERPTSQRFAKFSNIGSYSESFREIHAFYCLGWSCQDNQQKFLDWSTLVVNRGEGTLTRVLCSESRLKSYTPKAVDVFQTGFYRQKLWNFEYSKFNVHSRFVFGKYTGLHWIWEAWSQLIINKII